MAILNFNAAEIGPTNNFDAVPPGTYEAVITSSESKPMKSGNGMGFNFAFEIISGEQKGRKVFVWITYEHRTSPDAQRIGREQLSAICRACGLTQLSDTAQLHNLPLLITVGIDRNDPTRNVIKKYALRGGSPAASSAAQPRAAAATGAAPWAR